MNRLLEYLNIVLVHVLNHLLMFSLPALILYVRDDLNMNYADSGYLWTILISVMTVVSLFTGKYADNHPEKRYPLIYFGLFIMIVSWFLLRYGSSFAYFGFVFFLFGLGGSAFHPPSFTMITHLFEDSKGKALSFNMVSGMLTTAASPFLFGSLAEFSGSWQNATSIIASSTLGIAVVSGFIVKIKETDADVPIERAIEDQVQNPLKKEFAFIASPLIFIPLLFISVRSSFFKVASLFTSLIYEDYLNLSKVEATIATGIVLGLSSLFTLVGGTLSDKTHPKVAILVSSIGTFVFAISLVFLADLSDLISFSSNYGLLLGLYYIGSPAASALLANRAGKLQRGVVFGASFSLGQILGVMAPSIFGFLETNYGLTAAFSFIGVLAALGFIIGMYIYWEENKRNATYKIVYKG
ncbi:MAG: MFS transporter [Candidatus Heimdallarchaeota archaeon]|nr:MFS transporter [Candidatus Heimdallarchaeota archaeon]